MLKTKKSRFPFIKDQILRKNLDQLFYDITDLTLIMEGKNLNIQSNLKRAIIIYTGSIVEALLHYIVEKNFPTRVFEDKKWSTLGEPHIAHIYDNNEGQQVQVVCLKRYKQRVKFTKQTKFKTTIDILCENKIIKADLAKEINRLREKRNRIHLASLNELEKNYSDNVLEDIFKIAAKVTVIAAKYK